MKKILTLSMTLLFVLLFYFTAFASVNWYWITSDNYASLYIDANKISYTNINNKKYTYIRVWSKVEYNEEGTKKELNKRINEGASIDGYENLSYKIQLIEFAFNDDMKYMRLLSSADYTTDGTVLDSQYDDNAKFYPVIPESIGERLLWVARKISRY